MSDPPAIEPLYSADQRDEIEKLNYLLCELRSFRDRGMLAADAVAAIEAEKTPRLAELERLGMASGVMKRARNLAGLQPEEALALAEKARCLAPENFDAWSLSNSLLLRLNRPDEAVAVCLEGVGCGHEALLETANQIEEQKERARQFAETKQARTQAVDAAARGDYEAAVAACAIALRDEPFHLVTLNVAIKSLVALNRWEEAEAYCANLRRSRPTEAQEWLARINNLRNCGVDGAPKSPPRSRKSPTLVPPTCSPKRLWPPRSRSPCPRRPGRRSRPNSWKITGRN